MGVDEGRLVNLLATRNQKALKTMLKHLRPLVEERLANNRYSMNPPGKPVSLFLIGLTDLWRC